MVIPLRAQTVEGRNRLVGLYAKQVAEAMHGWHLNPERLGGKHVTVWEIKRDGKLCLVEVGAMAEAGGWAISVWVNGNEATPRNLEARIRAVFDGDEF